MAIMLLLLLLMVTLIAACVSQATAKAPCRQQGYQFDWLQTFHKTLPERRRQILQLELL